MNILVVVQRKFQEWIAKIIFVATVNDKVGATVKIQRVGQSTPDGQFYTAARGLAAAAAIGDKVICVNLGGTVIVAVLI